MADVTEASGLDASSQTLHCGRVGGEYVAQTSSSRVVLACIAGAHDCLAEGAHVHTS